MPVLNFCAGFGSTQELAVEAVGLVAWLATLCRALWWQKAEGDEAGWAQVREKAEVVQRELREVM